MKLQEMYEEFETDKEFSGCKKSTLNTYRLIVYKLFICDYLDNIDHLQLNINHIKGYVIELRHRNDVSPNTIKNYVRHLKVFINWMFENDYIKENITRKIPKMKGIERQVKILDDDEIATIIYSIQGTTERAWRKRAVFYVMLDCGLRIGEVISLKKESFNLTEGSIFISGDNTKGRSDRMVQFSLATKKVLLAYNQKRHDCYADDKDIYFVNEIGKRLHPRTIRQMVDTHAKKQGIKRAYPHLFRHTCLTRRCLYTNNIFEVQLMAGHKDLATTRKYHHVVLSYEHMQMHYTKTPLLLASIKLPRYRRNKYTEV